MCPLIKLKRLPKIMFKIKLQLFGRARNLTTKAFIYRDLFVNSELKSLTWRTPLTCSPLFRGALLALLCTALSLLAEIPRLISYQGILTDEQGGIVPDGSHAMTFAIYDSVVAGDNLWFENRDVETVNGIFDIYLGEVSPLTLAFDRAYYLESVFGGQALAPRTLISPSAYSLYAAEIADSVAVRSINGLSERVHLGVEPGLEIEVEEGTITLAPVTERVAFGISEFTTDLTADWITYEGLQAAVNCTGPGIVVCESNMWLQVTHTQGTPDRLQLCHSDIENSAGPSVVYYSVHNTPAELPSFVNNEATLPIRTVFEIEDAGEFTYYVNGRATQGVGGDRIWYGTITATFYPEYTVDRVPTQLSLPQIEKTSR